VDNEVLSQLPKDGTIISSIETYDIEPTEADIGAGAGVEVNTNITKADTNKEEPSPIVTAVPNLHPEL
jgi:hypothetical protein